MVKDIDLADTRYSLSQFSPAYPDIQLREHIKAFGILHPPLLLEQPTDHYIILSGRKRIQIVAEQGSSPLMALVIPCRYANQPQVIFSTLLQHKLVTSPLGSIEQAVFFQKAMACLPAEQVMEFLPAMGYRKKKHIPAALISLLELHPTAQSGLHREVLSLRAGKKLLQLLPEDQQILTELIEELQLGGSKQQKLIDLVFELTKRTRIRGQDLLKQWQEKEKDKQHNGPQKAASLLNWLQEKCSPRSVAAAEKFKKFSRQLGLPLGVQLSHTLSFEDERVTLNIEFRSKKNLEKQWPQIQNFLANLDL